MFLLSFFAAYRVPAAAQQNMRGDHHLSYPSLILQENVGFFH